MRFARHQFERPTDRVPKYLLQMNAAQKHMLIVDTRQSTLYVFENNNGVPRYLAAWSQQKRQVNAAKTYIKLKLDRISAFLYPGRDDLAVVNFDQD